MLFPLFVLRVNLTFLFFLVFLFGFWFCCCWKTTVVVGMAQEREVEVWLTRHGQSHFNTEGKIGGDSKLTKRGEKFAVILGPWANEHVEMVWTSTLKRSIQTAEHVSLPIEHHKELDELDVGMMDGLSYEEVEKKHPKEFAQRKENKYFYRYPKGESYKDVVDRVQPLFEEILKSEKIDRLLIICHQAVLRCLYGIILQKKEVDIPFIDTYQHHVIGLTLKINNNTTNINNKSNTTTNPNNDNTTTNNNNSTTTNTNTINTNTSNHSNSNGVDKSNNNNDNNNNTRGWEVVKEVVVDEEVLRGQLWKEGGEKREE